MLFFQQNQKKGRRIARSTTKNLKNSDAKSQSVGFSNPLPAKRDYLFSVGSAAALNQQNGSLIKKFSEYSQTTQATILFLIVVIAIAVCFFSVDLLHRRIKRDRLRQSSVRYWLLVMFIINFLLLVSIVVFYFTGELDFATGLLLAMGSIAQAWILQSAQKFRRRKIILAAKSSNAFVSCVVGAAERRLEVEKCFDVEIHKVARVKTQ